MTCEEARLLIDAHLDRELDPATDRELMRHLSSCARCAREAGATRALKTALGAQANYTPAPPELRRRIEQAINLSISAGPIRSGRRPAAARWWPRVATAAISGAIAALLAVVLIPREFRSNEGDFMVREVVGAHVRSTQASHLTDVTSTDRHTVKPWFAGKLDFSPPVADFQAQGFKLLGGRVDYLDDRAVAALIYQHGRHIINVFIWPSDKPDQAPAMTVRSGFNIDRITHAGMNYWIISDMSADEIEKLAALLKG
ncbi:MAG TPA: anti-sigma factor [Candidatus Binataceae bacterium]|nr:anti-sigma factor [Candidatus Binataceae bacterium]